MFLSLSCRRGIDISAEMNSIVSNEKEVVDYKPLILTVKW
jgi:hypothetical protein